MRGTCFLVGAFVFVGCFAGRGNADGGWKFSGSIRVRVEQWNFFDPGVAGLDSDYLFAATLTKWTAQRSFGGKTEGQVQLIHTGFLGLPQGAVAPLPFGDLGMGGSYRRFAGGRDGALNLRHAFIRYSPRPGSRLLVGRWELTEGVEGVPKDPSLAWIRRARVAERLIGSFPFSHIQRGFDGIGWFEEGREKSFALALVRPTRGKFDIKGSDHLSRVTVGYGSASFTPSPLSDGRVFAIWYRDERRPPRVLKLDNRPAAVRAADTRAINLVSLGGHWARLWSDKDGQWDLLMWGAHQFGDWGVLSHRAHAFAVEGGFRFTKEPGKPWLRLGFFAGTGDRNGADGVHQTFFQILPTARVYARTPVFNMMNNRDLFAQFLIQPSPRLMIRADYHRLWLDRSEDLWYAGGGAFNNSAFGFAGRPSGGRRKLMDLVDISLDYRPSADSQWTLYIGRAMGRDVVRSVFPAGSKASFLYLEWQRSW
ncbi:MAG: alginate export family protein [Armatimonadetes bacterium]|nr:alginate export family protein [Armatimonadota bacterium]MDW8121671.1 alginate export family protein [Armatimonadota bacterium]